MKRLLIFLLTVFGVCWSYSSHACDWDMRHWHGDAPGGWHGQDPIGKVQTDAKAGRLKEQYGTQMPQLALSPKELDQLLAFLKTATQ